ncbi:MAG: FAD-binding oxidoreductase [Rhodocyclaceae bacterium]|nr:MAG: FAD-binding oxidoreductase [Rhodocyclaceae bacterium]
MPHCPSVGLGGFTMGGGIGWNYPQRGGVSTHSIVGADVVTADGRLRRATPTENPDLYWAIRGAGPGFFGVVTRLDLQPYPLPKAILASSYIFPLAELEPSTPRWTRSARSTTSVGSS